MEGICKGAGVVAVVFAHCHGAKTTCQDFIGFHETLCQSTLPELVFMELCVNDHFQSVMPGELHWLLLTIDHMQKLTHS